MAAIRSWECESISDFGLRIAERKSGRLKQQLAELLGAECVSDDKQVLTWDANPDWKLIATLGPAAGDSLDGAGNLPTLSVAEADDSE